jgi:transposase
MLDWVPAQLRVLRTTRPKYACRACNKVVQATAPERLVAGGLATPALLAHVLISKYCDHLPLYPQSQIFDRHGVDLCPMAASVAACRVLPFARNLIEVATLLPFFVSQMRPRATHPPGLLSTE